MRVSLSESPTQPGVAHADHELAIADADATPSPVFSDSTASGIVQPSGPSVTTGTSVDPVSSTANAYPASSIPANTDTPLSAGAPTSTAPVGQERKGLTSGAKAGIGVGVTLGILLLIGIIAAIVFMLSLIHI